MNEKLFAEHPAMPGDTPEKRRQSLIEWMKLDDKAWKAARKPILDVLTAEQREKLDKLQGKKIEVKWPDEELVPKDYFGP